MNSTKTKSKGPRKRRNFGTIALRQDGSWEGKYYFNGKRYSIYGDSEDEIDVQLLTIEANIKNKMHSEESGMMLKDWLTLWLERYVKPSVRFPTYISYKDYAEKHVSPKIGHISLRSLDGPKLQKFFNDKAKSGRLDGKEGGLSTKTLTNIRNMLNSSFQQAIFDKQMIVNPLAGVKLSKLERKEMRVLSRDEMYKLLNICSVADTKFALGIIFTLYTGLRLGEVLGLRWQDVEWNGEECTRIHIRHSLTRQTKPGKSDPDYEIISWTPGNKTAITLGKVKTARSRRNFKLPQIAYDCLVRMKELQIELQIGPTPSGFVFVSAKGEALEPRTYTDYFYDLVKISGIAHANYHSLRHTFATRGHEYGIDIATLADLLGHAQRSTTMNMYLHSLEDQKDIARNAYNQMQGMNQIKIVAKPEDVAQN